MLPIDTTTIEILLFGSAVRPLNQFEFYGSEVR